MRAALFAIVGFGCSPESATPPPLAELELPGGERFTLHPPVVAQGTTVVVELASLRSSLRFDATDLSLDSDGLGLTSFAVLDGFTATGELTVADDAAVGPLDAQLTIDGTVYELADALSVTDSYAVVSPGEARMGEVIWVTLEGTNTAWSASNTWVSFGTGVQTLQVDVLDADTLTARVAIASDARPGWRDVRVEQQGAALTIYDGFLVDRAVITASFDPPVAEQGAEIDVVIEGVNTRFRDGFSADQVQFWKGTTRVGDLTFLSFEQVSDTRLIGRVKVSNAARVGLMDVFVDDEEDFLIQGAIDILPVAADPTNVRVVQALDVRRQLQADGSVSDEVRALAWFVVPLDPPCSTGRPPALGPIPFDIPGVFPAPVDGDILDCPEAESIDAGDIVFFESPTNVIPMERDISGTGQILYRGRDLTLADYHFGQVYDLRTTGSADLPAFTVTEVQPTVPLDYRMTSPLVDVVHDRFAPFDLTWTSAGVYPTGLFSISLNGTLESTGLGGTAAVLPFDDGAFTFRPAQLNQLAAGDVEFVAVSAVEGRVWQLPFNGRNHQGASSLVTRADLELR